MKKTGTSVFAAAVALALLLGNQWLDENNGTAAADAPAGFNHEQALQADRQIVEAFKAKRGDLQVKGSGQVASVLPDDTKGSQHQRFILRLPSGHTVLVAHNIDLAPRIPDLGKGDSVAFYGEYEWNERGGVIHWTHHDPKGRHASGWLKHNGQTYE